MLAREDEWTLCYFWMAVKIVKSHLSFKLSYHLHVSLNFLPTGPILSSHIAFVKKQESENCGKGKVETVFPTFNFLTLERGRRASALCFDRKFLPELEKWLVLSNLFSSIYVEGDDVKQSKKKNEMLFYIPLSSTLSRSSYRQQFSMALLAQKLKTTAEISFFLLLSRHECARERIDDSQFSGKFARCCGKSNLACVRENPWIEFSLLAIFTFLLFRSLPLVRLFYMW